MPVVVVRVTVLVLKRFVFARMTVDLGQVHDHAHTHAGTGELRHPFKESIAQHARKPGADEGRERKTGTCTRRATRPLR